MFEESEDAVEPQAEPMEQIMDQQEADTNASEVNNEPEINQSQEKTMIPLSVAQKLREKKRELELELQWEKQERQRLLSQQTAQKPLEEDNSRYESATREDLTKSQEEIVRIVEEKSWIRSNPEKFDMVKELLPQFLKQRPNLARAIEEATNRYEEAYTLMVAYRRNSSSNLLSHQFKGKRRLMPLEVFQERLH